MAVGFDSGDDEEITSINVTPLVDVTLVLLIIFMVTTTVITNQEGIQIDKPDAATGQQMEQTRLIVKCDQDDNIFIEDEPVADDTALALKIREAVEGDPAVQGVVLCDSQAQAGTLMHIIDLMREQGVQKYGVATEKPKQAPPAGG